MMHRRSAVIGFGLPTALSIAFATAPSDARPPDASIWEADAVAAIQRRNLETAALVRQGRYDEALALAEKTMRSATSALGAEHPYTLVSINNLGYMHHVQGRLAEAEPLFRRALETSD